MTGIARFLAALLVASTLGAAPAIFPLKDIRAGQHAVVVAMAQVARLVPHVVEMHMPDPGDGVGVEMVKLGRRGVIMGRIEEHPDLWNEDIGV